MQERIRTLALFAVALVASCKKSAPPEPTAQASASSSAHSVVQSDEQPGRPVGRPHMAARDDAGHLVPRSTPPPLTDADVAPVAGREPDWDLDANDPAHDYVERYIRATNRYGAKTSCTQASPSRTEGGRTLVEAREVKGDGCAGSDVPLDVFAVRAAEDRLTLADPKRGAPLGKWPDGSAPDAPPTGKVGGEDDLRTWHAPLHDALVALHLTPIRVQYYGRGSYPVITLAGWRDPITPAASSDAMRDAAQKLCASTKGSPLGLFASLNRAMILRVRCPDQARWERL